MKTRIVRIAFLGLAALVMLVVTLVLTVDFGRFKPQIEAIVSNALQRDFVIAGSLNIDIGRTIMVVAENVQLEGTRWSTGALASVGKLVVAIDAGSLLGDTAVIEWLEIEGLNIALEENAAGDNNWTFPSAVADTTSSD